MYLITLLACTGVTVTVDNSTPDPITDVSVEVTGITYDLGTLQPGEDATVRLEPRGESSVVVVGTRDGAVEEVGVPVYLEGSSYQGTITVDFQPRGEALIETDVRIGLF